MSEWTMPDIAKLPRWKCVEALADRPIATKSQEALTAAMRRVVNAVGDRSDSTVAMVSVEDLRTLMTTCRQSEYRLALAEEHRIERDKLARELKAETGRLELLEQMANGLPVEVDAFTGLNDPAKDQVFLTQYDVEPHGQDVRSVSHRVGQGRTLRAALDNARARRARPEAT